MFCHCKQEKTGYQVQRFLLQRIISRLYVLFVCVCGKMKYTCCQMIRFERLLCLSGKMYSLKSERFPFLADVLFYFFYSFTLLCMHFFRVLACFRVLIPLSINIVGLNTILGEVFLNQTQFERNYFIKTYCSFLLLR